MTDQSSAVQALRDAATAIEKLAFSMPPPNQWTPQFIMIANEMRRQAVLANAPPPAQLKGKEQNP